MTASSIEPVENHGLKNHINLQSHEHQCLVEKENQQRVKKAEIKRIQHLGSLRSDPEYPHSPDSAQESPRRQNPGGVGRRVCMINHPRFSCTARAPVLAVHHYSESEHGGPRRGQGSLARPALHPVLVGVDSR
ncbi:hypothetical protein PGT21_000266 [Puccinia graminis f. sp. tritici]|uniref:Uncharacterized protein n=1 Tax=Puccinia graminis f. sp. tritici TaxID=56615 RepID=A0A5B0PNE4_PUCGR|nr:hypothetical protein PGT21_000266 [Puccinia graminis f. sp. tritici]